MRGELLNNVCRGPNHANSRVASQIADHLGMLTAKIAISNFCSVIAKYWLDQIHFTLGKRGLLTQMLVRGA